MIVWIGLSLIGLAFVLWGVVGAITLAHPAPERIRKPIAIMILIGVYLLLSGFITFMV